MLLAVVMPLVVLAVMLPVVLVLYGITRWQSKTAEIRQRLEATRDRIHVRQIAAEELADLPAPVKRYLEEALAPGQPVVAVAELGQTGEIRLDLDKDDWSRFAADHIASTLRPGFDWDARIRRAPGLQVFVHDTYLAGEGGTYAGLFGLVGIAKQRRTSALAKAQLGRFLAESPWYPTKLLPSQGVKWTAIDDSSALATLSDGEIEVEAVFDMDESGMVQTVTIQDRCRTDGDQLQPTPWQGRFWGYELRSGMRIPTQAEAAWLLPQGREAYWRGRISEALYKFAP